MIERRRRTSLTPETSPSTKSSTLPELCDRNPLDESSPEPFERCSVLANLSVAPLTVDVRSPSLSLSCNFWLTWFRCVAAHDIIDDIKAGEIEIPSE